MSKFKIVMLVLKNVFLQMLKLLKHKKIGLLYPKSIVFIWFSLPFVLTLFTIYNSRFAQLANQIMGFDIKSPNVFKNEDDRIETLSVFISYVLLVQIIYAPFAVGDRRKLPFKLTSIKKSEIPVLIFRMISVIIIPRTVSLFLKNNVSFKSPEYSQIASTLAFLTTNIGVVALDKLWNPFSFALSSVLSILTITFNDSNVKLPYFYVENNKYKTGLYPVKSMVKMVLGAEYPTFARNPDDMILAVFLMSFWLIVVSSLISNIPFIDMFLPQQSFIRVLLNVCAFTLIPIFFKNISVGKKYSTEFTTMGSLMGIVGYTFI